MSDVLTTEEYQALAHSMEMPSAAFIDGGYKAGSGATMSTTNPATGEVICNIAACDASDVNFAVHRN